MRDLLKERSFLFSRIFTLWRYDDPVFRLDGLWRDYTQMMEERGSWTDRSEVQRRWAERGLRLAGEQAAGIAELCRRRGIAMSVAVYPWPHQILARERESRQVAFWRSFAAAQAVGFLDLFPAFTDITSEEAWRLTFADGHWNARGHHLVGGLLAAFWRQRHGV